MPGGRTAEPGPAAPETRPGLRRGAASGPAAARTDALAHRWPRTHERPAGRPAARPAGKVRHYRLGLARFFVGCPKWADGSMIGLEAGRPAVVAASRP